MTKDIITTAISILAFIISGTTAWLTIFRKGSVKMTQPTVIFFGLDDTESHTKSHKVFLRTLLYSTAKRGYIVESMWVKLHRSNTTHTLDIWHYGDNLLLRGSGIYVGENGVVSTHHFLLPQDGTPFNFAPGDYFIETYASLVKGKRGKKLLLFPSIKLSVSEEQAKAITEEGIGIYFNWRPDSKSYHTQVGASITKKISASDTVAVPEELRNALSEYSLSSPGPIIDMKRDYLD